MNTKNLKTISSVVSSTLVAGTLLGAVATGAANAQTKVTAKPAVKQSGFRTKRINPATKRVSMELQNASVRRALTQLFQQTGGDFSLDAGITGNVTLKVSNQPFATALRTLLSGSSQPLTYVVENGTYFIKPAGRVISVAASARPAQTASVDENSMGSTTVTTAPGYAGAAEPIGPNTVFAPGGPQYVGNNALQAGGYGPYTGFDGYSGYSGYGGYGGYGYVGGNTVVQPGAFAPGGVYGYNNGAYGYNNYGGYGSYNNSGNFPVNPYNQGVAFPGPNFYNPATGASAYYGYPNGFNGYSSQNVFFGF